MRLRRRTRNGRMANEWQSEMSKAVLSFSKNVHEAQPFPLSTSIWLWAPSLSLLHPPDPPHDLARRFLHLPRPRSLHELKGGIPRFLYLPLPL